MPTIAVKDASGTTVYLSASSGSGTSESPYILAQPLLTGTNSVGTVGLDAGSNSIGKLGANSGTDIGDVTLNAGSAAVGTVGVTSISSGDNNIGNVDIASALPAGTNNIGDVDVLSLPALPAGTNNIGDVDIASALPAGGNNIGDVDVLSLPALAAGDNNIGNVDIASAIPAGTNNIGDVDIASAIPAGTNNIGDVDILTIAAGDNNIGNVDIASALPAGTADVGNVGTKNLTTIATGERAGSATAVQLPTVSASLVRFKAVASNAGNVYVGGSGVSKPDGSTDSTTGLELQAGEDTGWLPTDNVNRFYIICDNAGDDITYMAMT